jgi:hypothetical protein
VAPVPSFAAGSILDQVADLDSDPLAQLRGIRTWQLRCP